MITIKRTNSENSDFRKLVEQLDIYLDESDKSAHDTCEPFNRIDTIKHTVVAYAANEAVGCGAIREYSPGIMEIKRMFVLNKERKKGIASMILDELENWARESGCKKCILETGEKLPEAINLYQKKGYTRIVNYGQYECLGHSVCFAKEFNISPRQRGSYIETGNILYKNKMNENGTFEIASDIEHKTLAKDGYSIHYFVSGNKNGEAVDFLHPAFGDHRCFDGQIDFFAQNYRVITVDLPGHGLSQVQKSKDKIDLSAAHVSEIMQAEGKAGAHIVGVSLGSLIAQYFGLQYPDMTLSLTALGGYDISADNTEVNRAQQKEIFGTVLKMIFSMNAFRRHVASVSCADSIAQARFYEASKSFTRKSLPVMTTVNKIVRKRGSV
ncbi:MAG: GNAT family N-acetyltransferase, partial [Tannerellaceae bacterium]|nr:GNAT family N-acetyltransferase [Tannerellaceae bacterium]